MAAPRAVDYKMLSRADIVENRDPLIVAGCLRLIRDREHDDPNDHSP